MPRDLLEQYSDDDRPDARGCLMPLRYTRHARARMAFRRLSVTEVEAVVTSPDVRYTDRKGNAVLIRAVGGRRLKVVVAHDDPNLIITVGD